MNSVKKRFLILASFISFSFLIPNYPAKSFVPKIYKPNIEELKQTGLEIGYIAANLIQIGQAKEGTGLAKVAISLNPEEVELWMILAQGQIETNKLKEALISIKKAKEYNPKIAGLWFTEASIALHQKKPDQAISSLKSGLKVEPKNAKAYFQLGNARIMKKQFNAAIKNFKTAYNLNKELWQAVNNEALVLYELGEKDKAIKTWEKTLVIKEDAETKLALAAALNLINPGNQKSITLAIEALNESPDYIYKEYREEQLWGKKIQKATQRLLENPILEESINKALARSHFENEL